MFFIKEPTTQSLIPLEDAEIVAECPVCGKKFKFPELWEMFEDDFTIDCGVYCDDCSAKSATIRRELENAGLTDNQIGKLTAEITKAITSTD